MTNIGLLSDTHGELDPAIFKYFKNVDEIWHAGDFGSLALADRLAEFKPLRGVSGNIDDGRLRRAYPEEMLFNCEELLVFMIHIGGYPGRYNAYVKKKIEEERPGLFISGHSHICKIMYDKQRGLLHINPGAAGNTGFHKIRTIIRFSINQKKISNLEVIELGKRGRI